MLRRVFIPFLAAMILLTIFVSWRASRVTSDLVESEYWKQMDRIAELLIAYPYLLNPTIKSKIEELVGAQITYYDLNGRPNSQVGLSIHGTGSGSAWPVLSEEEMRNLINGKSPHTLTTRKGANGEIVILSKVLDGSGQMYGLGLMAPAGPRYELQKNLYLALGTNAAFSLLVILVLTVLYSHYVSNRLETFLATMEKVADGKLQYKVPEKGFSEWRRTAMAFNSMVDRLKDYQQRLRTKERLAAVGELSAILAHEVRNPLTSLKMLGQVLKSRNTHDLATIKLIVPMLNEIDRIELLVKTVLDWSRPVSPKLEPININEQVNEVVGLMAPRFAKSGVKVTWNPGIISPVAADQSQIVQVVWNLLTNAENVSPRNGHVKVMTSMGDDGRIILKIEDQGPGISDDQKEKIYEPFFTTRAQGLGLGLTISRRILEEHNGELHLANRESGGAVATVILPAVQSNTGEDED